MHYVKRGILFILICCGICSNLSIAQTSKSYEREVISHKNSTSINYTFYPTREISQFKQFSSFFHQCGMPSLPKVRDYIIVPKHAFVSFKVQSKNEKKFSQLTIPQSKAVTIDSDNYTDSICSLNYSLQNQELPSNSGSYIRTFEFENFDLVLFEIFPYRYNPSTKELFASQNVEVTIASTPQNRGARTVSISPVELAICQGAANYSQFSSTFNLVRSISLNYLIVTHPLFKNAADSLALWKSQQRSFLLHKM